MKRFLLLLLVISFLFLSFSISAGPTPTLVCFSLKAAKRNFGSIRPARIDSVGFISAIWGVVWDSATNDIIIVGEKDRSKPALFFLMM